MSCQSRPRRQAETYYHGLRDLSQPNTVGASFSIDLYVPGHISRAYTISPLGISVSCKEPAL